MSGSDGIIMIPGAMGIEELEGLYRRQQRVSLDTSARSEVNRAARIVEAAAKGSAAVYGINTGFGKLESTRIDARQSEKLQRNLIMSHCCGVGEPLPDGIVRLVMALKINSLARGASGVRWRIIRQLLHMLNAGILPVIPGQGSVGASGDLAPLAHLTAAMMGEGRARVDGREITACRALRESGLSSVKLGAKEGLGLINGTQVSTALALAGVLDAWNMACCALVTGAMTSDAMMASTAPFRSDIQLLRGHRGQIDAAKTLRSLLEGSQIREFHRENDSRVQDPYCLRCQPQVMGACIDQLRHAATTLLIEANAVTDNPLVVGKDGEIVSGGNFHAEPVAFAADQIALAISEIGAITERRIASLVDPALNYGLPAFLSPEPGLNSGFMVAEITAAALMAENRHKAAPCSVDSTPTSANQEDHVSMACHGARRLLDMNRNLAQILGIELLVGAQGIGFRAPLKTSKPLHNVMERLRSRIPALAKDRYLADELLTARNLVLDGSVVQDIPFLPRLAP